MPKKFLNGMNINRFGSLLGRFSLDVIQPVFSLFAILMLNINEQLRIYVQYGLYYFLLK